MLVHFIYQHISWEQPANVLKGSDRGEFSPIGLARGNHPMPFGKYVFYYEIEIDKIPFSHVAGDL